MEPHLHILILAILRNQFHHLIEFHMNDNQEIYHAILKSLEHLKVGGNNIMRISKKRLGLNDEVKNSILPDWL